MTIKLIWNELESSQHWRGSREFVALPSYSACLQHHCFKKYSLQFVIVRGFNSCNHICNDEELGWMAETLNVPRFKMLSPRSTAGSLSRFELRVSFTCTLVLSAVFRLTNVWFPWETRQLVACGVIVPSSNIGGATFCPDRKHCQYECRVLHLGRAKPSPSTSYPTHS